MNPYRLRAYFYLILVGIIWGIAGPVIKITLKSIDPASFLLYRFFISSLVALPFLKNGLHFLKNPNLTVLILAYAFFNSTVTLGFLFWGTAKTTLLDMSLISLFGPLLMMLFGYLFLKDKITKREKVGAAIAFAGALIIALEPILQNQESGQRILGNFLIFLSLISGAISGLLAKKLLREEVSPAFLANLSFLVGFLTLMPIALIQTKGHLISVISQLPPFTHLGVFYMAIFSGTIAYTLNNLGQKTIELSEAALFAYLYPLISAAIAVLILGDALTIKTIIGGAIALTGVAIAEIKKKRYN